MVDLNEIRKLDPEERVRKLKELEESRKREIDEAESLIKDSMREINEAAVRKHAPIKQVTAGDISQLLTVEEKRVFKTARFHEAGGIVEEAESLGAPSVPILEEVAHEEAQRQPQQSKPLYGQAIEDARKGLDYGARMTTTGVDAAQASEEIYSSRSAAGQEADIQSVYSNQQEEGNTSGLYWRTKEKEDVKVRREREVW